MRQTPGFTMRLISSVSIAAAGYTEFGAIRGLEYYAILMSTVLLVGYVIWRIRFRN